MVTSKRLNLAADLVSTPRRRSTGESTVSPPGVEACRGAGFFAGSLGVDGWAFLASGGWETLKFDPEESPSSRSRHRPAHSPRSSAVIPKYELSKRFEAVCRPLSRAVISSVQVWIYRSRPPITALLSNPRLSSKARIFRNESTQESPLFGREVIGNSVYHGLPSGLVAGVMKQVLGARSTARLQSSGAGQRQPHGAGADVRPQGGSKAGGDYLVFG